MKPTHRETFNDGLIQYGHKESIRSSTKKTIGDAFVPRGTLYYRELMKREADYQIVSAGTASLDLKIKTPFPPDLRGKMLSNLTIVIRGVEYEVIKADYDQERIYLYFYLQRVGIVK
ncbi:phage head closure protein [Jeotgalibacillus haloalkalitolerans]|uniref:Phage head closure protein n=1 Tax=Jeotgalibacillus haloalkalitolerans TaxID=3104292 RepID=A0ABU5KLU2_9BACL|nr:phage head closure protein [Jeotgalibacillus sp. HH7-29]MDZ5712242.1 phage head closure protein [Jeotgalibacillus sp. HH7-29]